MLFVFVAVVFTIYPTQKRSPINSMARVLADVHTHGRRLAAPQRAFPAIAGRRGRCEGGCAVKFWRWVFLCPQDDDDGELGGHVSFYIEAENGSGCDLQRATHCDMCTVYIPTASGCESV